MVFLLDASAPCVLVHLRVQIWPQISYHPWFPRSIAPPRLSTPFCFVHYCHLSFPTLTFCADHTRRFVPFVRSAWNGSTVQTNLQLTICRFSTSLGSIPNHLTPRATHFAAVCTSFETSLLRVSLHDATASKVHLHSLVDPSLLESSDVGYSFAWTTCRLPPKDTQQNAVQNRIQTGCKREANETHADSHTHSPNRQRQSGV